MTTITPFLFDGEVTVRVIDWNGENGFVTTDVCRALGITNAADAIRTLDDDEKGIGSVYTLGGHQEMLVVSESGLYALIFKSRKPNAAKFRKWVTAEVLPALRRNGSYATLTPSAADVVPKPWQDWSLEERRLALADVNTVRRVFNQSAAAWRWVEIGLPIPPRHLLPVWWQADLLNSTSPPAA